MDSIDFVGLFCSRATNEPEWLCVNAATGEMSEDPYVIDSWPIGANDFQFAVRNSIVKVLVVFGDDAKGAFEFARKYKGYGYFEVSALAREQLFL